MSSPLIILGAGGHSKVLINALMMQSAEIIGLTDIDDKKVGKLVMGVQIIGNDNDVFDYPMDSILLINGLGSIGVNSSRRKIFERFISNGYKFASVIHSSAIVSTDSVLSEGVQVMAGAVIQPICHIGKNVLINTGAIVEHDCQIGDHAHIATGSTLSGGVIVGTSSHIGAGATVLQGIKIGEFSIVGAGATVISDVPAGVTVVGVPARQIKP
ncbi:acetyltransferase [Methylicorpusculum sp.]|uniref:acetyltransferase n=1 Tax=Methylicorpusculum sp. TaxID=2713644 RepID=UPI002ABA59B2|nr:acetyltransferase [Methylicorpusculum sp.]MDZ4153192.1 acetyltransferase [Methylicorpusculum sp.]